MFAILYGIFIEHPYCDKPINTVFKSEGGELECEI